MTEVEPRPDEVGFVVQAADTGCPFQAWSVAELLRARRIVISRRNAGPAR